MIPATLVRRGLESASKVAKPQLNIGSSRTSKAVTSRPSQVCIYFSSDSRFLWEFWCIYRLVLKRVKPIPLVNRIYCPCLHMGTWSVKGNLRSMPILMVWIRWGVDENHGCGEKANTRNNFVWLHLLVLIIVIARIILLLQQNHSNKG